MLLVSHYDREYIRDNEKPKSNWFQNVKLNVHETTRTIMELSFGAF